MSPALLPCDRHAWGPLGRIERTLFTLQWLSDPDLRQRSHAGLNKGEASNSLRRAIFFHRQGEIRDRTFENQSSRASGLSLITAAIVHWNTVYLERAINTFAPRAPMCPRTCFLMSLRCAGSTSPSLAITSGPAPIRSPATVPSTLFVLRSCPERLSVQFWTNRLPTP